MEPLRISITELREKLLAVIQRLDSTGEAITITRKGRTVAVLHPAHPKNKTHKPKGLFGARGALSSIPENEIDEMVEKIYQARRDKTDRHIDI